MISVVAIEGGNEACSPQGERNDASVLQPGEQQETPGKRRSENRNSQYR